jgi:transposase-like protein
VEEALIEMYLAGVSVQRVEDITEALWGTRVSPATVSELNKKIYGRSRPGDNRPIEGEHPIRRRARVVSSFPDGQSALNLAAARLRHIAGTAWSTKRYLNIELLKDQQMRGAITA